MPEKCSVSLQAQLKELRNLAAMVDAFGETHELSSKVTFMINLALDELITNVLMHGKFSEAAEPNIDVSLELVNDRAVLVVESNDSKFDPTEDTNPDTESSLLERGIGGLGLHLVKAQAAAVTYAYVDGKNQLTLEYELV